MTKAAQPGNKKVRRATLELVLGAGRRSERRLEHCKPGRAICQGRFE